MLWKQVGVLAHAVAGALDLDDDGMVKQAVQQGRGNHGVAERFMMLFSSNVSYCVLTLPAPLIAGPSDRPAMAGPS